MMSYREMYTQPTPERSMDTVGGARGLWWTEVEVGYGGKLN